MSLLFAYLVAENGKKKRSSTENKANLRFKELQQPCRPKSTRNSYSGVNYLGCVAVHLNQLLP